MRYEMGSDQVNQIITNEIIPKKSFKAVTEIRLWGSGWGHPLKIREKNMDNELYRQLQKHLHKQPAGFPETENGSEIDILKRFYTPEQAKIALKMTNIPEPPAKIARRLKMDVKKAGESLEQMAKEGKKNPGRKSHFFTGCYFSNSNSNRR